ncbi:hypothetical protein SDC9_208982 [bioreactor metagenome]|uniref:Uncharacterized protein n=1 Tax=bioreactor metagenome TaxID=1076179 RepID=A0A645JC33_9ZZZZ
MQRAQTLTDENIGIGTSVGRKQFLQFQILLRHQGVELFFRQAVITYLRQFTRHGAQIGGNLVVWRFDVDCALRAQEQHAAVKAEADIFRVVLTQRLLDVPEQRLTR